MSANVQWKHLMPTVAIPSDYLDRLILKVRGIQGREAEVDFDSGSNATDDNSLDALQDREGDLSRREVSAEIEGLNDRQQAELIALLWLGRGDVELDQWEETIEQARAYSADIPTYLLSHPLLAEFWADAIAKLNTEPALDA